MKYLFIFIFLLFINCNVVKKHQVPIEIKVLAIEKVKNMEVSQIFYSIKFEIINNSKEGFLYWAMSCSWDENFLIKPDCLQLTNLACLRNVPEITVIYPGETKRYSSWIFVKDLAMAKTLSQYKIGFVHIKPSEVKSLFDFRFILRDKLINKKDILWSQESIKIKFDPSVN